MNNSRTSLSISARRHFVDRFFFSQSLLFKPGIKVLDIGGKKKNKRGLFDISIYGAEVTYVNIDQTTEPDIVSDASNIPLPDSSFDVVILGEILEHVPEPIVVLKEAHRLLSTGGTLLATVPFMVGVHGDPDDYGRYTETFWRTAAGNLGFTQVKIESQGTIFAVIALMIQHIFRAKGVSWRPIQVPLIKFFMWLDKRTTSALLKAWTTGYGLTFTK